MHGGATLVKYPSVVNSRVPASAIAYALAADLIAVLVFAAVGRRSHDETGAIVGVLFTAWPFLVGCVAGWVVARVWRQPRALRAGVLVWGATWLVGMGLRDLTGRGVQPSFLIVAAIALGVLIVGWRVVVRLIRLAHAGRLSGRKYLRQN